MKKSSVEIYEFCMQLANLWYNNCNNWRFGQFIYNTVLHEKADLFYIGDKDFIKMIENYFDKSIDK